MINRVSLSLLFLVISSRSLIGTGQPGTHSAEFQDDSVYLSKWYLKGYESMSRTQEESK